MTLVADALKRLHAFAGPAADGAPADVATLRQVHGDGLVWVERGGAAGEGDGLLTQTPGVSVAVRTADCVPLLLSGRQSVGAVHAGWRGAAAGIAFKAVAQLLSRGEAADDLQGVLGPSIRGEDYEVGEEVVQALAATGCPPATFVVGRSVRGRPCVDVAAVVAWQLRRAGVRTVVHLGPSTFREPMWASARRDGVHAGRNVAWIRL